MQKAIYHNYQNTDAQHEIVTLDMAASHLLYRQFEQGHLFGHFSAMAGCLSAHRMENGPRHPGDDDTDI